MIHDKIWDSDQFMTLKPTERLLYIATITGANDHGHFRADEHYLKRKVFWSDNIGYQKIADMIQHIKDVKLIELRETARGLAGRHPNWLMYQSLRKERMKPSEFPEFHADEITTDDVQLTPQVKLSEEKESEYKGSELMKDAFEKSKSRLIEEKSMRYEDDIPF